MKRKGFILMRLRVQTTLAAPFSLDTDAEALTANCVYKTERLCSSSVFPR